MLICFFIFLFLVYCGAYFAAKRLPSQQECFYSIILFFTRFILTVILVVKRLNR